MKQFVNISIESRSDKGIQYYRYRGFPYVAEMKYIKKRISKIKEMQRAPSKANQSKDSVNESSDSKGEE